MCGRVIRTSPAEVLAQLFDLASMPDVLPDRYNLAPKQPIPVVRFPRQLELLRWGLDMPDPKMAGINARVESLTRPIYRKKVRDKRCLVVVDGFYEWKAVAGTKHPYLIAREDKAPMVFAGIYDSTDGCAIITAPSQGIVATLHDRMPVMLDVGSFAAWIDPSAIDVRSILATASADGLVCYPVSRDVNNVRNDNATLVERVEEPLDAGASVGAKGKPLSLFSRRG